MVMARFARRVLLAALARCGGLPEPPPPGLAEAMELVCRDGSCVLVDVHALRELRLRAEVEAAFDRVPVPPW